MIAEVEKAFSKGKDGDAAVKEACANVKEWVEREWTDEREKAMLSREKSRFDSAKAEAIQMLGQAKWNELERQGDDMKGHLLKAFDAVEEEFFEYEKTSEDWKVITQRLRDAASKGAAKKNVVQVSNDAKEKLSTFITKTTQQEEGFVAKLFRGETTLASIAEQVAVEAAKHIGQTTTEKDEDKIPALGAMVRFKKGGQGPLTPAALLVRVSDCAPICLNESKKFEDAMCIKPGARSYIEWIVKRIAEAFNEERLDLILNKLSSVDATGGKDQLGQLQRAVSEKDWSTVERLIKTFVLSSVVSMLPQLDLPPIEGNRDGVAYTVKGMDLSHFHVDERNVRFIGKTSVGAVVRGDPVIKIVIDDLSTTIKGMQWSFKQEYFPYMTGQGVAHADVKGVCIVLGFQLVKRARSKVHAIVETVTGEKDEENGDSGKSGSSSSPSGSPAPGKDEVVPQLVLGIARVTIDSVKIKMEGGGIYAMLTDVFAKTIRTYASSLIQDMVVEKLTMYLEKANEGFAIHGWDAVSSALEIDIARLPTEEAAAKRAQQLDAPVGGRKDTYSVTFAQEGPMGLALGKWNEFVVVKAFKKAKDGSALPAESSGKIKIGDILVGFNGGEITSLPLDRVTTRISRSRRPLTLSFAPGDANSMEATKKRNHVCKYRFEEEKLFLLIKARPSEDKAAVVTGFRPTKPEGGGEGPAERAGVPVGWVLAAINSHGMLDKTFKDTMAVFTSTTARPIELKFVRDPDFNVELNESPVDMKLVSVQGVVVVSGFSQLKSPAEMLLGDSVQSGDFIVGIGSKDTTLMKFDDTIALIRTAPRPVEIRFGRYGVNGITSAGSFGAGPLGMVFYRSSSDGRCCFKAFQGIEGPVERLKQVLPGSVLRTVNGTAVTTEEQAKELLSKATFPVKLGFRDMEAFEAGGWPK